MRSSSCTPPALHERREHGTVERTDEGNDRMQFLMLVCRDAEDTEHPPTASDREAAPDAEAWWRAANASGRYVMGDRLRPAAESRVVRVRGGETLIAEGGVADGGGLIAGFDVLECASMEEAVEIAAGHPMAYAGAIEVRQLWPFDEE